MKPEDGLAPPHRYWAVLTTALAIGMAVMDNSMINVVLPVIAEDLNIPAAQAVWVVNAYLLAVATTLLPLSSLGDILGYRRVYRAGLLVFTAASLSCMLADSLLWLTVSRLVQGLGAAGIMSVNVALVRFIYPSHALGRGIGINAMVVALSTGLGPTVAAGVLAVGSWHWLFALNLPLGILALVIAARTLPTNQPGGHRFDTPSAVMNALGIGLLVVAIDSLAHGVRGSIIALEAALAVIVIYRLVRRQLARPQPLLPVDLLAIRPFALAAATSMFSFTSHMMAFVALPFYFHDVIGYSPVRTGLMMTPWPLAVMLVAPFAGRLADRYPAGLLCAVGLGLVSLGLCFLAALPPQPDLFDIVWRMALGGAGFGLFHSPNNRALLGAAPRHRSGGAAGIQGTARLLGQTCGAAFTALIFQRMDAGTTSALWCAGAVAFVAAVISLSRIKESP